MINLRDQAQRDFKPTVWGICGNKQHATLNVTDTGQGNPMQLTRGQPQTLRGIVYGWKMSESATFRGSHKTALGCGADSGYVFDATSWSAMCAGGSRSQRTDGVARRCERSVGTAQPPSTPPSMSDEYRTHAVPHIILILGALPYIDRGLLD